MTTTALEVVLNAVERVSGRALTHAETKTWCPGEFAHLRALGLLREIGTGTTAPCPHCDSGHIEVVDVRESPSGRRFYIECPDLVRVEVVAEMLNDWEVCRSAIPQLINRTLRLAGKPRVVTPDLVWLCGRVTQRGVSVDVYFAIESPNEGWGPASDAVSRSVERPLLFVPARLPTERLADSVFALSDVATVVDGALFIDASCVKHAITQSLHSDSSYAFVFRRYGDVWKVAYDGGNVTPVNHGVGMDYLARLLAEPNRDIAAVTLLADRAALDSRQLRGSSGESLDPQMKEDLKRRYDDAMSRKDEAEARNDLGTLEAASRDLEVLTAELGSRLGIGKRARSHSDAEKVRKAVSMAVRRAVERVGSKVPELGKHLNQSVTAGRTFRYSPEREIEWHVSM